MSSFYRQQLEQYLSGLDIKANRVLDIGGGANPVKGRVRSFACDEYSIADNESEDQKQQPDIVMDINYVVEPIRKYDVIFCLEVMEYVFDPVQAIKNIKNLTTYGGTAYITFPFLYPVHNPIEIDYMRYTRQGVEKLLSEAGFESWMIYPRTQQGTEKIQKWYSSEKMHAAKGYDGHDETGFIVKARK